MITSIFNIFIFSITLIILCNFQCTTQFFPARIIRVFTLCSQAHWKQNSLKKLVNSSLQYRRNNKLKLRYLLRLRPWKCRLFLNGIYSGLRNFSFAFECYRIQDALSSSSPLRVTLVATRSTLPKNSLERR